MLEGDPMDGGQVADVPETRYAKSGELHIAYQVLGDGPFDVVFVPEFWHSIEAQWEEPGFEKFLRRIASFSRLICFDERGTGLSDPVALSELPTLETWIDDVRAVMEAVGSSKPALLGSGGGGVVSALFAASHPENTRALVLINSFARLSRTEDYPWGTSEEFEKRILRDLELGWGRGGLLETVGPSVASNPEFRKWWARYQRLGSSPGTVITMRKMLRELDIRHVLPSIRVPTLIVHRKDNGLVEVTHGRYLAEHVPAAKYVEAPGVDYFPFVGDSDLILDEIEEFLTGMRDHREDDRMLVTVVMTDIVRSTERAAAIGDRRWRDLIERHNAAVRRELARFRGREVDTAGDGFLAAFDGPARAIRFALAAREVVATLGLEIRAGLHTGEVEVAGDHLRGIAVHIGARVMAQAEAGEVLASSTVKDLVAGSGVEFEDRGTHALKGVPAEWRLYAVSKG